MKLYYLIFGGILITACSSPSPEKATNEVKKEVKKPVETRDLLEEYKVYLGSLDSTNEQSVTLATRKYEELFAQADEQLCDSAFVVFHRLYEKIEGALNAIGMDDLPCVTYDEEGKELPMDKRLVALEKRLNKHGFRIECWEGFPGIAGERAFIANHFYSYVSPEMKLFLEGLRKENDQMLSADAGISITAEEYVERLIWWENFNKKHPDFILSKRARSIQRYLFTYFLIGMDNTPAINYPDENDPEKMELDSYFVKAYDYLNKKYPNSVSNSLVKPYKMTILKNDDVKKERLIRTYTKRDLMIDFEKDYELDM